MVSALVGADAQPKYRGLWRVFEPFANLGIVEAARPDDGKHFLNCSHTDVIYGIVSNCNTYLQLFRVIRKRMVRPCLSAQH